MAMENIQTSQLRLIFFDREDEETGEIYVSRKSFNNIKPTATAEQLLAVAEAFASLQQRPLLHVERQDLSEITSE